MNRSLLLCLLVGLCAGCERTLPDQYPGDPVPEVPTPERVIGEEESEPPEPTEPAYDTLILGHRGIGWNVEGNPYPENTHLSVQAALAAGADGVEVDVVKSADDVFVLRHDNRLSTRSPGGGTRRSNCGGHITDKTWSELETCLANPFGEDGFRVPLDRLEFILDLPLRLLILDIKNDQYDIESEETVSQLASLLDDESPPVMLMLYQPETVLWAEELGFDACLKQHQSVADRPDFAQNAARHGAVAVCMNEPVTSRQVVLDLYDWDLKVISYYLSSRPSERFDQRVTELARWGVSAIITDLVERSRNVLDPIAP